MISKKDFNQTEEKFGAQSSNAKSERQREFDNNNNIKGQNRAVHDSANAI